MRGVFQFFRRYSPAGQKVQVRRKLPRRLWRLEWRAQIRYPTPVVCGVNRIRQELALPLIGLSALLGVLQNAAASMIIDSPPFLDLLQGSKAPETGEVVVQAAIADAWGLRRAVGITH